MARETQLIRKLMVFSAATHLSGELLRQKGVLLPHSLPEGLQGRLVHRVLYFSGVQVDGGVWHGSNILCWCVCVYIKASHNHSLTTLRTSPQSKNSLSLLSPARMPHVPCFREPHACHIYLLCWPGWEAAQGLDQHFHVQKISIWLEITTLGKDCKRVSVFCACTQQILLSNKKHRDFCLAVLWDRTEVLS